MQIQVVRGRCSIPVPVFAVPDGGDVGNMEPPMAIPSCAEECALDGRVCSGSGFDTPAACCSLDYKCIRRDDNFSQCRFMGRPGTRVPWDGREEVCRSRV